MKLADVGPLFADAGNQWVANKAPRLGAALAYYTIFSIAPLLVISIAVAGLIFEKDVAQDQVKQQIEHLVGEKGGEAVQTMLKSANEPGKGSVGTALGILMLLVGATGLFGELQDALNTIWGVQQKPGQGIMNMIRTRFMSLSMVLCVAFLLLVSLLVSAGLSAIGGILGNWQTGIVGQIISTVIDLFVISTMFALIFRYLPDALIAWRDVWFGAIVTALLFTLGKLLIGLYLGQAAIDSAYGAAGSLAVLLVWVYYSAQIFLFGAELTKAFATRMGSRVAPKGHAEAMTAEARAREGLSPEV